MMSDSVAEQGRQLPMACQKIADLGVVVSQYFRLELVIWRLGVNEAPLPQEVPLFGKETADDNLADVVQQAAGEG